MQYDNAQDIIEKAIQTVAEKSPQQTDGKWLEDLTVCSSPYIKEWDVARCYLWADWPEREAQFPNGTSQDPGIDVVAIRRGDGRHIAIQCKARQLDEQGHGGTISRGELNKFIAPSADPFWVERWLVTNGDSPVSPNVARTPGLKDKPIKVANIANDLLQQQATFTHEDCPHCEPDAMPDEEGNPPRQTKTCMQREAVAESVRILREHEQSNSVGTPVGEARGKSSYRAALGRRGYPSESSRN